MQTAAPTHLRQVSTRVETERRFDRRSWFVFALALLLLVVGIGQKAYRLSLPTAGWTLAERVNPDRRVFEQNLLGKPSPLQAGDSLVAIAGVNFAAQGGSFVPTAKDLTTTLSGETVDLTVLRKGKPLRLTVPLYHWTLSAVLEAFLFSLRKNYAGWLALLVAAYLFWQRPRTPAAQLLLLFFTTKLVIDISWLISPLSVADLRFPLGWLAALLFSHLSYFLLLAPLVLHLCLSFPEPKTFLLERPWLVWLSYGVPWLFSLGLLLGKSSVSGLSLLGIGLGGVYPCWAQGSSPTPSPRSATLCAARAGACRAFMG